MNKLIATAAIAVGAIWGCEPATNEPPVSADAVMEKDYVVQLVWDLEAEINNGGFDQFFFNSAGDHTGDTISALTAIGALHTSEIVLQAAAKFPNGMPPVDRDQRQDLLEKISPDAEAFESQDRAFLEYKDDLQTLVDAFKD